MGAVLYEDSLQQIHDGDKHALKHEFWAAHGVTVRRTRFDGKHDVPVSFGDYYAEGSNVVVDTKANVHELMGNLGGDYRRFDHECRRAYEAGYQIVFVCEGGERLADTSTLACVISRFCFKCRRFRSRECDPTDEQSGCVERGKNRKPFQGYMMMGKMKTLHRKYGAEFEFVDVDKSAARICELLGVRYDNA